MTDLKKKSSEQVPPDEQDSMQSAVQEKVAELAILKESLDREHTQATEYYDQLIRLRAEYENFRKRVEREKSEIRRWGKEEILLRLIGLIDVMEQASATAHQAVDIKTIVAGIDLLSAEFRKTLKEEGLEEISTEDRKFNPACHEAVDIVETEDRDGEIIDVLQKGYRFHGHLLRPTRVRVAKIPTVANTDSAPDKASV
ncbi:MAG TPA: nucleotide exchange factor GrpE [Elusimicrobiota bacterium]|nr:nucleotide exchange factor GrpE [Elusimicrobiota bacterium]